MYVYIDSGKGYQVGYYSPDGRFRVESEWAYKEREGARKMVHYLNGGDD